ncbi:MULTISPECIES: CPBP family intramembrane glutamic endopeptidase [Rhizobium]|uniref:CPBP family intramembrane metalloprotease n=1 Tax=Rhizobium rhododendri TaxID=2506430 RepID=A0ABY8ITK3_9HYPH|nr:MULTISPECIES: CPBP family intramembrane glutamic endopeptidase [Rhizobium]TQX84318.1 CPBP family intramembrane metalloprotease [Rhizobium sp. rho-13.1]TQY07853.1 CPBP family intramembrane metalloprotease [Rhizobium sp. rho-1.1]WFS26225.1 CPBP family intramembrane metalloprotease [Rhizobium rhododendri]
MITGVAAHLSAGSERSVVKFFGQGIAWPMVFAVVFMAIVISTFRWWDLGFSAFSMRTSLKLSWLPMVYLAALGVLVAIVGLPPLRSAIFIGINTVIVGMSEEVMFRGILFTGLRSKLRLWPSLWVCCGLFGFIHVLNALPTGQWTVATLQAVAAFQTGFMLMALRLRTGSLYPVILLHAVWDCSLLLVASHTGGGSPNQPLPAYAFVAPLFLLPNFLYALYLLRPKVLAKN